MGGLCSPMFRCAARELGPIGKTAEKARISHGDSTVSVEGAEHMHVGAQAQ